MNQSNIEFEVFGRDSDGAIKIVHGIGATVCLILGSAFYGGTIIYEKYGGDPMKRSLRNKLITSSAFAVLLIELFVIGFAWRVIVSPLNIQGRSNHFCLCLVTFSWIFHYSFNISPIHETILCSIHFAQFKRNYDLCSLVTFQMEFCSWNQREFLFHSHSPIQHCYSLDHSNSKMANGRDGEPSV